MVEARSPDSDRLKRLPGEPNVVWTVAPNPGPLTLDGTRSYRVGSQNVVLVDPGPDLPGQLDRLRGLVGGLSVEAICLTHAHRDHSGMAARAAQAFDAPVAASAETLRRLDLDGRSLADGDPIELDGGAMDLTTVPAPGHSADHVVFFLDSSRSVFTGDLVLGTGSSAVLHPDGDVGACLATFTRLLSLRPGRLFPGHGPPVDDGRARLLEYREHRLARHAEVVDALRAGNRSVGELRRAVYGELDPGLEPAADASIRAHLVYVRETGGDLPPVAGLDDTWSAPEEG
jgi:hydroxyacylglutathione hydrolase